MRTPEESNAVYLWLAAVGIEAERIQQKLLRVMANLLKDVQSTVRAIQSCCSSPAEVSVDTMKGSAAEGIAGLDRRKAQSKPQQ